MATQNHLLSGEKILLTSDNDVLTLTNYRVKYDAQGSGSSKFVTITLDTVASCGLITQSKPILLVIAAISAISGFAQHDDTIRNGLLFVAFCFAVAYFLTRSGVITVSSSGGEHISIPAKGMKHENIRAFVEAVVDAKLKFIGKVRG